MSEFWVRKVRTYFAKKDGKNAGVISKRDAEIMAEHIADAENASPQQKKHIKHQFVVLWRALKKSAGSDDEGLLTADIMVASVAQQKDDPEFHEQYIKTYRTIFTLLDQNNDRYLSEAEYARLYAAMGIQDTSFVHDAFQYVDVNKDGKLSVHEYTSAMWKYLTTEDEHLIWGPLVD